MSDIDGGRRLCVTVSLVLTLVVAPSVGHASSRENLPAVARFARLRETLRPLATPLGKPRPGDWLESHPESGQTFGQYLLESPVLPIGQRRTVYILPIGDFSKTDRRIVRATGAFLERFFDRPVRVLERLPLSVIPPAARRVHPEWGVAQILSTYVLRDILRPRLPADAAAFIALTTSDLWPGKGWNFVFGQANLRKRVGVWSLFRNGDPARGEAAFRLCLLRAIKTASHEIGHMFSMRHCILYECNMCGSNNRGESDRRPLALCPECLAKVCWATGADPMARYEKLAALCERFGFKEERAFYLKAKEALERAGGS